MCKSFKQFNKKSKELDFSRRKIVSFLIIIPFVGTGLFNVKKSTPVSSDEFVLVNGWILKKKDLDVV